MTACRRRRLFFCLDVKREPNQSLVLFLGSIAADSIMASYPSFFVRLRYASWARLYPVGCSVLSVLWKQGKKRVHTAMCGTQRDCFNMFLVLSVLQALRCRVAGRGDERGVYHVVARVLVSVLVGSRGCDSRLLLRWAFYVVGVGALFRSCSLLPRYIFHVLFFPGVEGGV